MFSFASTSAYSEGLPQVVPIIQLCHLDDIFYNGATVIHHLNNIVENVFAISGYEHEELIDYYCNKNSAELLLDFSKAKVVKPEEKEAIKNIYLDKCYVIKPNLPKMVLIDKLIFLLCKPLKTRARNYHFPTIAYTDIEDVRVCNFVFLIEKNNLQIEPKEIKEKIEYVIDQEDLSGSDDFFIVSIENNPYNNEKSVLLIIYSGERSAIELFDLWSRFDNESLFNKKRVVYKNGQYIRREII